MIYPRVSQIYYRQTWHSSTKVRNKGFHTPDDLVPVVTADTRSGNSSQITNPLFPRVACLLPPTIFSLPPCSASFLHLRFQYLQPLFLPIVGIIYLIFMSLFPLSSVILTTSRTSHCSPLGVLVRVTSCP